MLILENVKLALSAIRINKMRAFLTMLGIIIGISSVIAITAIGSSIQSVVDKQFASMGKTYMYVYVNWYMLDDGIVTASDLFTEDDIESLREKYPDLIDYAVPYGSSSSQTRVGRTDAKFTLTGVGAGYDVVSNMTITYGRMINENDVKSKKPRIVIDETAAEKLFGRKNAVGETLPLTVDGVANDYTIVGIYYIEPSIFTKIATDNNFSAYIPYSMIPSMASSSSYIEVYYSQKYNGETAGNTICRYMERLKGKQEGFYTYESAEQQQGMMNDILGTISLAIGAIAAISLLVGGIGIMNIMLVSVTERTREIGIRKALGARTGDILFQFLIESMIISAIGGLIGTALGITVAAVGMTAVGVDFAINPMVIVLAVSFSAVVGIFFGIYPARKAAKLDPIEALRYE